MGTPGTPQHVFDAAISLSPNGNNSYAGRTNPAYGNLVGPFGGAIAATLLNAVVCHPERLGEPLSLTVHYAAPIADGEFSVQARAMRTNRSTQHWLVELVQADGVAAFATAVTAVRRDTWGATDACFPPVPLADSIAPASMATRVVWTGCYEMRFIDGEIRVTNGEPGTAGGSDNSSLTRLWIRDQPPRPLDFLSLSAICDAFFPRIFLRRPKWVPIGTVVLSTHFHADAAQLDAVGTNPVLGVARALNFQKGFFDQSAEVWSSEGILLATSHQVVYYKE
jgi:hypothetical protein